jgi:hypothetical protein
MRVLRRQQLHQVTNSRFAAGGVSNIATVYGSGSGNGSGSSSDTSPHHVMYLKYDADCNRGEIRGSAVVASVEPLLLKHIK